MPLDSGSEGYIVVCKKGLASLWDCELAYNTRSWFKVALFCFLISFLNCDIKPMQPSSMVLAAGIFPVRKQSKGLFTQQFQGTIKCVLCCLGRISDEKLELCQLSLQYKKYHSIVLWIVSTSSFLLFLLFSKNAFIRV